MTVDEFIAQRSAEMCYPSPSTAERLIREAWMESQVAAFKMARQEFRDLRRAWEATAHPAESV
jgi:hypothetical protein